MSSLIDGAKKLVTRGTDLGERIEALDTAVTASRGRLPDELVGDAQDIVERASSRMRLSAEHTVVALAGATGSGKSSTFNALTGIELAAVGVRRPTTSWATACVWGREGAGELLEWLGIPERHQVTRDSMLDTAKARKGPEAAMQGVVLLDLPDHDSTEVSHHLEVDRLVKLADLLIWVLDPQKYADAALHDRYLRPLASHQGVMLVVLNHIDTVAEDRRAAMVADVERLLELDGLRGVKVIPVSAREGIGMDDLRRAIAQRVESKRATKERFETDIKDVARRMQAAAGTAESRSLSMERAAELDDALADAAGVPTVVSAVEKSTRQRANRATGWPLVSWVSKVKPDPLKRLHLDLGEHGKALTGSARTSVPEATKVQRARVDAAVRGVADDVGQGLSRPWQTAIGKASTSRMEEVGDQLDRRLGSTDLGASTIPWWAGVVRVLQWILILTALAGLLWLTGLFAMGYLRIDPPNPPALGPFPLPAVMLIGGVLAGILLALICRFLVAATARGRARRADKALRKEIHEVSTEYVITPVRVELDSYDTMRRGLERAAK